MKQLFTKQTIRLFLIVLLSGYFFLSCKKNDTASIANISTPPDLSTKIISSIKGFVTDENNTAVQNASVQMGATIVTTDKYGYFEIRNTEVIKNAAVAFISKQGYFKAAKTFIAETDKVAFFRIKLIPKINSGTIAAVSGGTVTLSNNLSITLPAGSVVNVSNGSAYSGTVNVAAYWIDPTAADLRSTMPGDLRGLNNNGEMKLLTTYGMAAVELTGNAGELLQVAPGKKATVKFPIPAAILPAAPATIPLWYFDETKGLWKEEGSAVKNGTYYSGDVSHFSFWNCDMPNNYIQFNCTIKNQAGQPLQNLPVKISVVNNPYNATFGYTDSAGYTGGAIPSNAQLLLEVFSNTGCSTTLYSQNITTTTATVSLGTITVNLSSVQATVSGTVTSCNFTPVTNGFIIVQWAGQNDRYPVTNGSFNFNMNLCSTPANATLIAEDISANQKSAAANYNLHAGNNAIGNIQACGITVDEYYNFTVNGTQYRMTAPYDALLQDTLDGPPLAFWLNSLAVNSDWTNFMFTRNNVAVNSDQTLLNFFTNKINDTTTVSNPPILVHITEYGPVGQFFSGNFTGVLKGNAPANKLYNISCNFRIRRQN